jgi:hypothetical protein
LDHYQELTGLYQTKGRRAKRNEGRGGRRLIVVLVLVLVPEFFGKRNAPMAGKFGIENEDEDEEQGRGRLGRDDWGEEGPGNPPCTPAFSRAIVPEV